MEVGGHQVQRVQHGEENPPGPENVRELVHQAGQELVCQPLYRFLRVVEVKEEDILAWPGTVRGLEESL